jgi:hypothetical protein
LVPSVAVKAVEMVASYEMKVLEGVSGIPSPGKNLKDLAVETVVEDQLEDPLEETADVEVRIQGEYLLDQEIVVEFAVVAKNVDHLRLVGQKFLVSSVAPDVKRG